MKQFKAPERSLKDLDAKSAASLITVTADIALIIDAKGIIRDVAFGSDEIGVDLNQAGTWIGRSWSDTVTPESRPKVEALLQDAAMATPSRGRQVNHPSDQGIDVPIVYSAVPLGRSGRIIAVGRDLRPVAELQQRLLQAQQAMERDYWRLRHAETRYRMLFRMATEAVVIVDADSMKVVEANPAAESLLGKGTQPLTGRLFGEGFEARSARAIQTLLATVRVGGRSEDVRARLADGVKDEFVVSASLLRQDEMTLFLVRVAPAGRAVIRAEAAHRSDVLKAVENVPDAFVLTDPAGRIITVNRAFLDLVQLASEEQVRGEAIDRWLGRPGVDFGVIGANLRQHGSVRLFATTMRGEYGASADVEISAVSLLDKERTCYGFVIRNVAARLAAQARGARELPKSVDQLAELVGRVSLKDLVREATDVIERLSIEAALELTGDNRASAAEMLGLSRQSLYVKLRRYGLGDLASQAEK